MKNTIEMKTIDLNTLKQNYLKPRAKFSHKGDFGHVFVIGGEVGMAGAVKMAGEAALRTGAGLVSVLTQPQHAAMLNATRPELMTPRCLQADDLHGVTARASVLAIGPGLGRLQWGQKLFAESLKITKPKIIDADALWFLSRDKAKNDNWILTPHPGEAAQLLNITTTAVQAHRQQTVQALQIKYGGVVILKGAGTLVYDGKHPVHICEAGNPGMASGGMGDVLTGIIAGLVAQKIPLFEAACLGVILHTAAGDLSAQKAGERGMLATDLFDELRSLIN
jgi:NAD(P)H-hydrate epimerase